MARGRRGEGYRWSVPCGLVKCGVGMLESVNFCWLQVERAIARRKGQTLPPDPEPPAGLDPGFRCAPAAGLDLR